MDTVHGLESILQKHNINATGILDFTFLNKYCLICVKQHVMYTKHLCDIIQYTFNMCQVFFSFFLRQLYRCNTTLNTARTSWRFECPQRQGSSRGRTTFSKKSLILLKIISKLRQNLKIFIFTKENCYTFTNNLKTRRKYNIGLRRIKTFTATYDNIDLFYIRL